MSHLKPTKHTHVYQYTKKDGTVSFYPYYGSHCIGTFATLAEAVRRRDEVKTQRKQLSEQRKQLRAAKNGK